MQPVPDVYEITLDWGNDLVEHLRYHLPSLRLIGSSWLLKPLGIPTKRVGIDMVDKLITFARRMGASVQVTRPWPPLTR